MSNILYGNFDAHEGQHQGCPTCFTIKIRSLQFQGIGAGDRRSTEKTRGADMDAYKRLRMAGVQPQHVFGSSEVEKRAGSQFEAEHHLIMSPDVRKEFTSRLADSEAMLKESSSCA